MLLTATKAKNILDMYPNGVYHLTMTKQILQTVVETPEFIKQAEKIVNRTVINEFISYIASSPLKGELIKGTGGVRKIRWQSDQHSGKRGGIRIIYYYHSQTMPLFLFTAYAKNRRANITQSDKIILRKLTRRIVETYEDTQDE